MREKVAVMVRAEFPIFHRVLRVLRFLPFRKTKLELDRLLSERVEDNLDPVTSLVLRRFFMRAIMRKVEEKLPELEISGQIPSGVVILVVVLFGDFAFLSYFNSLSFATGDKALARTGQILNDKFSSCLVCRLGGDEFAILSNDNRLGDVLDWKEAAQGLIADEPYHQLDLEYATIDDVRDLLEIYPMPTERRVKFVVNALTDIAMARAQISKYYERIGLLVKLYLARNGLYEALIDFARKGGAKISDAEVAEFARRVEAGEDISLDCLAYAINAKAVAADGDPYQEAVLRVAEKIFITSA